MAGRRRPLTAAALIAASARIAVVAGSDSHELEGDGDHAAIADPDGAVSRRFGVVHVPLVFLVDEQSRILAVTTGERPDTGWRSFLESGTDAL